MLSVVSRTMGLEGPASVGAAAGAAFARATSDSDTFVPPPFTP